MFINVAALYCLLTFANEVVSYGVTSRGTKSISQSRSAVNDYSLQGRYSRHSSLQMKAGDDSELTKVRNEHATQHQQVETCCN